ncbi:UbiA family prenyltransferase [Candidatus Peregrinibacteria bacterium]|nr:UbiA family prenyltransferase [Candidatus Peregrinibacteria bacterium]
MNLRTLRRLLRVEQWYKNLLIFLPYLFLRDSSMSFWPLLLAFFSFSAISSSTYILNDWIDRKEDALHPLKKTRPLASGEISGFSAVVVAGLLICFVLLSGFYLGKIFLGTVCLYFALTNLYSFGFKKIPLLDSVMIASNFVLRTAAGFVLWPGEEALYYLSFVFGLTLILLSHKRRSDIKLLGEQKAIKHKAVLKYYTPRVCYLLRLLAYILVGYSFCQLASNGGSVALLARAYIFLLFLSIIFSRHPDLAIKPHRIFSWIFGLQKS